MRLARTLRLLLVAATLCIAANVRAQLTPFGDAFLPQFTFTESYDDIVVASEFGGYEQAAAGKLSIRAKLSMKDVEVADMLAEGNSVTLIVGDLQQTLDLAFAEISNPASGPDKGFTVYTWPLSGIDPRTGEENNVGAATLKFNSTELRFSFDADGVPGTYSIRAVTEAIGDGVFEDSPVVLSTFSIGPYGLEDLLVYYSGTTTLSDKTVLAGTEDEQQFFGLARVRLTGLLDSTPPNLTIDYPASGTRVTDRPVTFNGRCSDRFGIQAIEIQIDAAPWTGSAATASDDPWVPAAVTGDTWTLENIDLAPGKFRVRARCTDANGLVKIAVREASFSEISNLTVTAAGDAPGRVSAAYFPALTYSPGVSPVPSALTKHAEGKALSVTAVPGNGAVFDGWTANKALTPQQLASPKLSFKHQPNMVLTAHFLINPFIPVKGRYNGLAAGDSVQENGFVNLSVGGDGNFTGSLKVGKLALKLKGKFSNTGRYTRTVKVGSKSFTIDLTLNVTGIGRPSITGSIEGGDIRVMLDAARAAFDRISNPASQAGTFNVIIPPASGQDDNYPLGAGYGRVIVTASGLARFTGRCGTSPAFNAAAHISAEGEWPFFSALYGRRGTISGMVTFDLSNPAHDVSGTLRWFRPGGVRGIPVHSEGFDGSSTLLGARYSAPGSGERIFLEGSAGAGKFVVNAPANATPLPALQTELAAVLGLDNKVSLTFAPGGPLQNAVLAIKPLTGMFAGSFTDGVTLRKCSGIIVSSKVNRGAGAFRYGVRTGAVDFIAP